MPKDPPITIDQIRRAAEQLGRLRPTYQNIISFYEALFVAQERAKGDIDLEPVGISEELRARQRSENLPLTELSGFVFDGAVGGRLLKRLCELIGSHHTEMTSSAGAVLDAVDRGEVRTDELFENLLSGDDRFFQRTAERIGSDKSTLAFLAYHSIQPCIEQCAVQLAHYLDDGGDWRKGFCPVCGSPPGLAVLGQEGIRDLHCSFCRHSWRAPRIFCPFCENTRAAELDYFFSEQEKDLRVDVCDRCRKYIKTVDKRVASRPVYPPLEQVASLHLDFIAVEKGYTGGIDLNLGG